MKSFKKILYSWVSKTFLGGCSSYNSLKTRKSCRSKKQARAAFSQNGIPHAKGDIFLWPQKAIRFAREHGFPLVIKPNVSGFSRGSHFPITNYKELWRAMLLVKVWWPTSVIEQYLLGKNYRIVVVKDEIMSVIQRYPAFIIGNGTSSIGKLIDEENEVREKLDLYPVIHPINKNRQVAGFLKKSRLSFDSIPAAGETITLFNRVALAPGGVVKTVDKDTLHPDNLELFLKILPLFEANILGIDAIFEQGINISHKEQQAIFLEVNSRPYLKMHDYPRFGEKEDLRPYYAKLDALEIKEQDIF